MLDSFSGTLLGTAVGDMMGAPYEGMTSHQIWERFGEVQTPLVPIVTDDTEMSMAVARSLCRKKRIDPEDISREFLAWYDTGPTSIGRTTFLALQMLKEGVSWQESGKEALRILGKEAEGNGSVMRTAPIGLFGQAGEDVMVQTASDVSRITHASPVCINAAVSVTLTVSYILQEDLDDALEHAQKRMVAFDPSVADAMARGLNDVDITSDCMALRTVHAAFRAVSRSKDFHEAVVTAISYGGDTDTFAAVTGALAGAAWGRSGIPLEWLNTLDRSPVNVREIASLAQCIHDTVSNRPPAVNISAFS